MTNNTVTLDLSSGGGRQTLPAWDNTAVEITTTWSNNKTASDNSVCNAPALSIDVPANFQYNAQALQITASNIPAGVTLSSVSVSDGNTTIVIPATNISMAGNTITVDLIGLNIPTSWNNTTVTWLTTWSDSSTASDNSICKVTVILDGTSPEGVMPYDEGLDIYLIGCISQGSVIYPVYDILVDGVSNTYDVSLIDGNTLVIGYSAYHFMPSHGVAKKFIVLVNMGNDGIVGVTFDIIIEAA